MLRSEPERVIAQFADVYHEMACILHHDGEVITDIEGRIIRFPTNICTGAVEVLRELKGTPINTGIKTMYANRRAKRHCTHLFDLAVLAIQQSRRAETRHYEAVVPDMTGAVDVSITRNGELIHQWNVADERINSTGDLQGKPLIQGFMHWASEYFSDVDDFEAALILSRTVFIARGRRFDVQQGVGSALAEHKVLAGSCFAYQPERVAEGYYISTNERDCTEGVEIQPLNFR